MRQLGLEPLAPTVIDLHPGQEPPTVAEWLHPVDLHVVTVTLVVGMDDAQVAPVDQLSAAPQGGDTQSRECCWPCGR